jgi:hypothetical protein
MHPQQPPFYFPQQQPMYPPQPPHLYSQNPNHFMYPTPPNWFRTQIGVGSSNGKLPETQTQSTDDEPPFFTQVNLEDISL